MNTNSIARLCIVLIAAATSATQAGPLTPPAGSVTSTYKTLSDVEPRTALSTFPVAISVPGSYYLAANVELSPFRGTAAINISATGKVTLDLNGFTVKISATGSPSVIGTSAGSEVVIRNGWLVGSGTSPSATLVGINSSSIELTVEDVAFRGFDTGVSINGNATLRRCSIVGNPSTQRYGVNTNVGARLTMLDSDVTGYVVAGVKIVGGQNSNIERCRFVNCGATAISAVSTLVADCMIVPSSVGISMGNDCVARNNRVIGTRASGSTGIQVTGTGCTLIDNIVTKASIDTTTTPGRPFARSYDVNATAAANISASLLNTGGESVRINFPATMKLIGSVPLVAGFPAGSSGILVDADNATIDLNGFALIGTSGSGAGISTLAGIRNLTVRNGTIRNWGGAGIEMASALPQGLLIENVTSMNNTREGFFVGSGGILHNCIASGNSREGFIAASGVTFDHCSAISNAFSGFLGGTTVQYSGCISRQNGGAGYGQAGGSTGLQRFSECVADGNAGQGFDVFNGSTVNACTSRSNSLNGILAGSSCLIEHCTLDSNGSAPSTQGGISVTGSGTRVESNNLNSNDNGIFVTGTGNIILHNTAHANILNYSIVAGNSFGAIVNVAGSGDLSTITNAASYASNLAY